MMIGLPQNLTLLPHLDIFHILHRLEVWPYQTWYVPAQFVTLWLWTFAHITTGPKNAEPEFSDMTYFAMLFSAGVGVGLFFFGVSEPLFHLTGNRYDNPGYHSEDEMAAWSLTISLYHW